MKVCSPIGCSVWSSGFTYTYLSFSMPCIIFSSHISMVISLTTIKLIPGQFGSTATGVYACCLRLSHLNTKLCWVSSFFVWMHVVVARGIWQSLLLNLGSALPWHGSSCVRCSLAAWNSKEFCQLWSVENHHAESQGGAPCRSHA